MSLARASLWTASATLVKISAGLLVIKLLALTFGPNGVGQAGNFRQLITVLGVLAGAGIFNGVTKFVAQYQQQPQHLRAMLGTASSIILGFSSLLALIFLLAAKPISQLLFSTDAYQNVIRLLGLLQMAIAWANYLQAILRGLRDARANALVIMSGSMVGLVAYYICFRTGGYSGALAGLAAVPALLVLPAFVIVKRQRTITMAQLYPGWDKPLALALGKFTLMALITSVTVPLAYVMIRNLLAQQYSWHDVGIWQGVSSISDAYLQFITASFSVWLLPTLARLENKQHISRELLNALKFVLPAVMLVSFTVWLLRDLAIWLLFSQKFTSMRDLFAWQLAGDVLKTGCYVFGYLVIAKASLRFYLLTEISQFALLSGFSCWLIPAQGAIGATQAYMATYIIYFVLCCGVFFIWRRKA